MIAKPKIKPQRKETWRNYQNLPFDCRKPQDYVFKHLWPCHEQFATSTGLCSPAISVQLFEWSSKKPCKQPNVINFQEVPMPTKGGTTTIPTQEKQQNHGKTRYQHDFPKSSLHWMSTSGCRRTSTTSICLDSWSWILENYAPNQGTNVRKKCWLYIIKLNVYRCYIYICEKM